MNAAPSARLQSILADLEARGIVPTPLNVIAAATDAGASDDEAAALAALLRRRGPALPASAPRISITTGANGTNRRTSH